MSHPWLQHLETKRSGKTLNLLPSQKHLVKDYLAQDMGINDSYFAEWNQHSLPSHKKTSIYIDLCYFWPVLPFDQHIPGILISGNYNPMSEIIDLEPKGAK